MAESTKKYLDCNATDFSGEVQAMLKRDRELYDQQKALRKQIASAINGEFPLPEGEIVTSIAFTRWGQLQVVVDKAGQVKSKAKPRLTLADYQAQREAQGLGQ